MIHEAYMPVYMGSRFLARTDGTGRDQSKVVQEVLADLKNTLYVESFPSGHTPAKVGEMQDSRCCFNIPCSE